MQEGLKKVFGLARAFMLPAADAFKLLKLLVVFPLRCSKTKSQLHW